MEVVFGPYTKADREACLCLLDANCPEFFAPNERAEYAAFLGAVETHEKHGAYEVCRVDGHLRGAFGVFDEGAQAKRLHWIMLDPQSHGCGVGRQMMNRVLATVQASGAQALHIAASHMSAAFFAAFGAHEVATTPDGWGPDMHRVDMTILMR